MIPKIIHFCWLSKEPYPAKIQKCINSWKEKLPDYEIVLWDTNKFDVNKTIWTKQAFEKHKYAFVSDYIRFYALYYYGGIYLDSDVEVVKNFDDLLGQKFFWGFEYSGMPEAAVFGAEKGQEWIKCCMQWYENKLYDMYTDSKMITAQLVFLKGFESIYRKKWIDQGKIINCDGGTIYPCKFFSPKDVFTGEIQISKETYAVHHFTAAWLNDGASRKNIAKKKIHTTLIKYLGKDRYNVLMFHIRKILHKL